MITPRLPALALAALSALLVVSSARPAATEPERSQRHAPASLEEAVKKLASEVHEWGGTLGVSVVDLATGKELASFQADQPRNPASNAKLVTAAAALRVLGPGHRFVTGLYGKLSGDTVDELVLRGDGDPSFRSADLYAMATELRAAGVRKVRSIAVDQSLFDDEYVPPAFAQQPSEWAPFRAPVAPVSLDENTVLFSVRPTKDGHAAVIEAEPRGFVDVTGRVDTRRKGDPEKLIISLQPRGSRLGAALSGNVPEGSRPIKIVKRADDPRLLAGYALRSILKDLGVEVASDPKLGGEGEKRAIASHRSAALGELLGELGKQSDNFYAEMIFKAMGAAKKGRPASAGGGAEAAIASLKELGAFEEGTVVVNGSGLFDADRISAKAMVSLLRAAYQDPSIGPEYVAQLSIGGVDGTLKNRFKDQAATRAIRAKTGTLDAVAALSGYVLGPKGRAPIAFSILVNGISGKVGAARQGMDRVVESAAAALWKSN